MDVLRVTNLSHSFSSGKSTVEPLRGVDLIVGKGQFVAITGPSGCGKTTLLLACGAMRKPTGGVVSIDGDDVYGLPTSRRAALRSTKIGYLFQTMELLPYLSVLDNLLLVPGARATDADKWLSKLGLTDRANHRPDSLSQGEMQRAALARAMIHNPMLVIADEPTGNLDPDNTAAVFKSLQQYANDGGAVLVASHETNVANLASQTYRLESGGLTAIDAPTG
jgi:ABC-type lipoprotein export system ATPase subunit